RDKYRAADPERRKRQANIQKLRQNYGLSVEEFEAKLAAQGGVCAICKGPPNGKGRYHVDHCHKTGKVRGLLCHHCNLGIGNLKDDADLVLAAAAYLVAHE